MSFSDEIPGSATLCAIKIRCWDRIDAISLVYTTEDGSEKTTQSRGGDGGRLEYFYLDPDELIIAAYIWSMPGGSSIQALQFQTNKGRLSLRFGEPDGNMTYTIAQGGGGLVGINGVLGGQLKSLGIIWGQRGFLTRDAITTTPMLGTPIDNDKFCDLRELVSLRDSAISKIRVRSSREGIYGIQVTYIGGKQCDYHGGTEGDLHDFSLARGEFITGVEGRVGNHIERLEFITNLGRRSGIMGGHKGEPFRWTPPDRNYALLFFSGSSGDWLCQLQGHFYPIPTPPTRLSAFFHSSSNEPQQDCTFDTPVADASNTISWTLPVQMTLTFTVNASAVSSIPIGQGVVITGNTAQGHSWNTEVGVKCADGTTQALPVQIKSTTTLIPEHVLVLGADSAVGEL